MDLKFDGNDVLRTIKSASYFPYMSGHLRDDATIGIMLNNSTYCIKFNGDIAPYVQYLEEGTTAHNIPGAFGRSFPFGYGGRFDGFFHPGSTKHYHFIQNKVIDTILMYFITKYNGEVRL